MSKSLQWLGIAGFIFWVLNIVGAGAALFTDEFLGRSFQAWMVSALVGWCMWLQAQIQSRNVVVVRIKPGADR